MKFPFALSGVFTVGTRDMFRRTVGQGAGCHDDTAEPNGRAAGRPIEDNIGQAPAALYPDFSLSGTTFRHSAQSRRRRQGFRHLATACTDTQRSDFPTAANFKRPSKSPWSSPRHIA
jgi:hypothetical protein